MGIPVLVLGESGSGKSTALRNFEPNEIGIFNIASKPLPFRKEMSSVNGSSYAKLYRGLESKKFKAYAIDDSQYLMAFEMFDRAKETGYAKFTDVALQFRNLIQKVIAETTSDTIVYFLHHTETSDTGKIKAKTSGKMLDNQLTVEGLYSIVLLTRTDGSRHWFETQSDGNSTAKSPMGMFDREIENDLKLVDTKIREYWNLNESKENE